MPCGLCVVRSCLWCECMVCCEVCGVSRCSLSCGVWSVVCVGAVVADLSLYTYVYI